MHYLANFSAVISKFNEFCSEHSNCLPERYTGQDHNICWKYNGTDFPFHKFPVIGFRFPEGKYFWTPANYLNPEPNAQCITFLSYSKNIFGGTWMRLFSHFSKLLQKSRYFLWSLGKPDLNRWSKLHYRLPKILTTNTNILHKTTKLVNLLSW